MKRLFFCLVPLFLAAGVSASMGETGVAANMTDDPYVWLEDTHGEKPLQWVKQTNEAAQKELKGDPRYAKDEAGVLAILDAPDRIPMGRVEHGRVYNFWQDAKNVRGIWRRTTAEDYEKQNPNWDVFLDLDKLAADEKENWVFAGSDCAPAEKRCLLKMSRGGGDAAVVREFDLTTKSFVKDGFVLPEAKTDATWLDDDTILFATDFGPGSLTQSGYARIVKLWKRGQKIADAKTLYEGDVKDILVAPATFHDKSGNIGLIVRAIGFFENIYFLLLPDGTTIRVPLPVSADVKGYADGQLIATLREDWQQDVGGELIKKGALIAFDLRDYSRSRTYKQVSLLYTPTERESIDQVATGNGRIYAAIYSNVIGAIYEFRHAGGKWMKTKRDLPANGSASIVSVDDFGPRAYFSFESFLTPTTLYADSGDGNLRAIKSLPARFDASRFTAEQFEATSADGTKIPYFLVRPKAAKGPVPTILYGYGGFEVSQTPWYWGTAGKLWLEDGGAYAIANIRGGGEFGPAWHKAALKENRQRAFDDFIAVGEDMVKRNVTSPKQLGIMGGSNGGLLVSTVMVERPDLFGAVVCQVPLIDMIRYTKIGAGASWADEYGDPEDPKYRAAILRYSPYQNVKKDVRYPSAFFVTATSDDRVSPVHARKMAAKMIDQGHDVLFFENMDGGHSAAANHKQAAEMWALSLVYLKRRLGLN